MALTKGAVPGRTSARLGTWRPSHGTVIHWFRNDLRLVDNPSLVACAATGAALLPVHCDDPAMRGATRWGFERVGPHRRRFHDDTLQDLGDRLQAAGSALLRVGGSPALTLPALAEQLGATAIHCESIPAPEEVAQVVALRDAINASPALRGRVTVVETWQSTLHDPGRLPFQPDRLPQVFTAFRQQVERGGLVPAAPLGEPSLPPLPAGVSPAPHPSAARDASSDHDDPRSSFPYRHPDCQGGAFAALSHLARYFATDRAHRYKATRNAAGGTDHSTRFSPWLATGALSVRTIYAALKDFETRRGANEGSYWIEFELLWRDYFRFLHRQHGVRLYRAQGLSGDTSLARVPHDAGRFARWTEGRTGEPLVDAGMRELAATGWLSNRLRQVVASYLVYDLQCDWRAGAAWFESQLIDYDACSNQGNWLYIAGRGTDPRGGRRFDPGKQAREHDPDGHYRRSWNGTSA
jgi:deoxyribodipyrimidine photo-lyase